MRGCASGSRRRSTKRTRSRAKSSGRRCPRAFTKLCDSFELLLDERKRQNVEIEDGDYQDVLSAVLRGQPRGDIATQIKNWRLEPTLRRLVRIGEQARALAQRTGKGTIAVDIKDHALRLDSRASSFAFRT